MRVTVLLFVLSCALPALHAAEPAQTSASTPQSAVVMSAAPAQPAATPEKQAVARRSPRTTAAADDVRVLGDVKVLGMATGEARLRVDGTEQTLKPGMLLKTDMVKSITPQRMVLLRPDGVDGRKGETLIFVDVLAGGRTRVRTYAARNWSARAPKPVE
jgi:hypothetical protein